MVLTPDSSPENPEKSARELPTDGEPLADDVSELQPPARDTAAPYVAPSSTRPVADYGSDVSEAQIRGWLKQSEQPLRVGELRAIVALAAQFRADGVESAYGGPKVIKCINPKLEQAQAAKVKRLVQEKDGYTRGPRISIVDMTMLPTGTGLEEIVDSLRVLGFDVVATNTKNQKAGIGVSWRLYFREGDSAVGD